MKRWLDECGPTVTGPIESTLMADDFNSLTIDLCRPTDQLLTYLELELYLDVSNSFPDNDPSGADYCPSEREFTITLKAKDDPDNWYAVLFIAS